MRKKIILLVGVFWLVIPSLTHAWQGNRPNFAPSTGSSTWWHGPQGVVAEAKFSWDLASKIFLNDVDARFDWTADCDRIDGPQEPDQVHANAYLTDVPNVGVYVYDDCGTNPSVKEEIELDIYEYGVQRDTQYYWRVFFDKRKVGFTDGEINISMERGLLYHWWLEKEQYWYN